MTGCCLPCLAGCGGGLAVWALAWRPFTKKKVRSKIASTLETLIPPKIGDLKTDVTDVDFDLGSTASVRLGGLTVNNPEGFHTDYLIRVGDVAVSVKVGAAVKSMVSSCSKMPKVVEVTEIVVENCHIIFEEGLTTSNFSTMQQRMKEKQAQDHKLAEEQKRAEEGGANNEDASAAPEEGDARKPLLGAAVTGVGDQVKTVGNKANEAKKLGSVFQRKKKKKEMDVNLRHILLKGVKVTVKAAAKYGPSGATVVVDDIEFKDFTEANGKIPVEDLPVILANTIVGSLWGAVCKAISRIPQAASLGVEVVSKSTGVVGYIGSMIGCYGTDSE
eukprot:TRINITY_DN61577_c0_g1_i1.p1 TRINITY_DN61577_c0_g1~~TRINITY_DN61577_c0_g1_i1.p1  ORF type:complete len:331 (-),score=60.73 TRINITY_DN61577_c0_g1_i1:180-1172(-)